MPAGLPVDIATEGLHDEALGFMAQDLAGSTLGTYSECLKYVVRFFLAYDLFPFLWNPDEWAVCWMAAWFARSAGYKSVCNYLKGYKYFLKVNGWDVGIWQKWVMLPRVLKGIRRVKGDVSAPKQAITPEMLLDIVKIIPAGEKALAVWVAMLVGFYAFLRKAHLCVEGSSLSWTEALLLRKHIALVPAKYCVIVTVGASKTVQFKQRAHDIVIQGLPGHLLDPYFWVSKYLATVPAGPEEPAFGFRVAEVYSPLTYCVFVSALKGLLSQIGQQPELFAGHSLRRGGATCALKAGVNPLFIRIQGDWNSDAWLLYVGLSHEQKRQVTLAMQQAMLKLPGAPVV
jgi:hypothetical protein